METEAGRAVMKIPATSATTFVYSGAADANASHTLYFQDWRQSLGIEVLEVICCSGRSYQYRSDISYILGAHIPGIYDRSLYRISGIRIKI